MLKKIGKIALLVLIFAGGFAAGLTVKYYIDDWRAKRNVALWMESFEAPYKNDRFGGKTPEETFDMYLAALKKGDLELASRYFWVDEQKKELKALQTKNDAELNNFVLELENIPKRWIKKEDNEATISFEYKNIITSLKNIEVKDSKTGEVIQTLEVKPGEYTHNVIFKKLNNIWKIYSL